MSTNRVLKVFRDFQGGMSRLSRLLGILVLVLALYGTVMLISPQARSAMNHQNLAWRLGFYAILTLGAGVLILSGGIDLSMGSVVGLAAVSLALLVQPRGRYNLGETLIHLAHTNDLDGLAATLTWLWPYLAVVLILLGGGVIGLIHGLLVTRLRLQPFLVTLCGLFIYRGLAQWATRSPQGSPQDVGLAGVKHLEGLRFLAVGRVQGFPMLLLVMLGIAGLVFVLLHLSVYGRYLYAVGYNEQAARYAGVATSRYKILAYVLCAGLAALGGVLTVLDLNTASPTNEGQWLELYAITGAVLGGCSLRGGEGTVVGMLLGAAVLPLLWNLCNFVSALNVLQFAVIGAALLLGTVVDEMLKRRAAGRH
jgi:ribose transport system permease protein